MKNEEWRKKDKKRKKEKTKHDGKEGIICFHTHYYFETNILYMYDGGSACAYNHI